MNLQRLIFIVAGLAAGTATAEPLETKVGATARFRHEESYAKSPLGGDRTAFSSFRIRPSLLLKANSTTSLFIEPQFAKTMGGSVYSPSSGTANSFTETSGNTGYAGDSFAVFQAYMDLKLSENLNLIAGRQALKYGDEYVLGPSDWGVYGRSFDAMKVRYATQDGFVDLFTSKIVENTNTTSANGGDKDLSGLYASWKLTENIKALELYYFYLYDSRDPAITPADAGRTAVFATYGTRWVTAFDSLSWKFEYAKNSGTDGTSYITTNENTKNDMFDTEVAYQATDSFKSRVGLQVFSAQENWRDLYPTTAKALGRVDVVGRRNLSGGALRYSGMFSDYAGVEVDGYLFQRTSTDKPFYGVDSRTSVGLTTASDSKEIGSELDMVFKYISNPQLTWSLGACFFSQGSYLRNQVGGDAGRTSSYGFLMMETKF